MKPKLKTIKLFGPPVRTNYALHFQDIEVTFDDGSKSTNVMVTYEEVLRWLKSRNLSATMYDVRGLVWSDTFTEVTMVELLHFCL